MVRSLVFLNPYSFLIHLYPPSGNLCGTNGTCVDVNETEAIAMGSGFSDQGKDYFRCSCENGFEGRLCERGTDECAASPCKNNGTCHDLHLDYRCTCARGWEGATCEGNVEECATKPCANNGKCVDGVGDYTCDCFKGRYKGKNCTVDVDECTETKDPCSGHGSCANRDHGYDCTCTKGRYGDTCQYNNTEYCAHANPCNYGTCMPNGTTDFYCTCDNAHTGPACEHDVDECTRDTPCRNGANCTHVPFKNTNQTIHYTCNCTPPFEGSQCETARNSCTPGVCLNGGACTPDVWPAYRCTCVDGYIGSNCGVLPLVNGETDDTTVIIVAVVVVLVVIIIAIILFICYYKKHSGQEGTYKPGEEENKGGIDGKELDVIKKPKPERLI